MPLRLFFRFSLGHTISNFTIPTKKLQLNLTKNSNSQPIKATLTTLPFLFSASHLSRCLLLIKDAIELWIISICTTNSGIILLSLI